MAQMDIAHQYGVGNPQTPIAPVSPTIEQLLRGESPGWTTPSSPAYGKDHFGDQPHNKKSVLAKVRDKAKRWRQTLGKKKQNHDEGNVTPSWGVTLEDDDEDTDEDPEYLGAPMYESELAPEECKETARQHPREAIAKSESLSSSPTSDAPQVKEKPQSPSKTISETMNEKLAPAYETVAGATHTITSKFQNLATGSPRADKTASAQHASATDQMWDKGVSIKEYLMHKLEPGEDEKALSEVITEAISPRKTPGESGVVGKVREAVSSFLQTEKKPLSRIKTSSSSPSDVAISTNVHEVLNEENHGRILQAN